MNRKLRCFKDRRDIAKFLEKCAVGEVFTYSDGYGLQEVVQAAKEQGIELGYCVPGSLEYKKLGCFTVKVISIRMPEKSFMDHTLKRIAQLQTMQKEYGQDIDRALVIQQLEFLIETFEEEA